MRRQEFGELTQEVKDRINLGLRKKFILPRPKVEEENNRTMIKIPCEGYTVPVFDPANYGVVEIEAKGFDHDTWKKETLREFLGDSCREDIGSQPVREKPFTELRFAKEDITEDITIEAEEAKTKI